MTDESWAKSVTEIVGAREPNRLFVEPPGEPILVQYTIHDHPSDYPGHFVVTRWGIWLGGVYYRYPQPWALTADLASARLSIPIGQGLVCLTRAPDDDPRIVETWL